MSELGGVVMTYLTIETIGDEAAGGPAILRLGESANVLLGFRPVWDVTHRARARRGSVGVPRKRESLVRR
jgi:hypothetical protein